MKNLSYSKIKNKKSFLRVIKSYLLRLCAIRGDNALYVVKLCVMNRMIYDISDITLIICDILWLICWCCEVKGGVQRISQLPVSTWT